MRTWRTGASLRRSASFASVCRLEGIASVCGDTACPRLLRIQAAERTTLPGQPPEQRRRLPELAELAMKFGHAVVDFLHAYGVGIPHRAAAIRRETVSGQVHGVDIGGAQRVTLFQDARAFVDHGVNRALDDLLRGDGALRHAGLARGLSDERLDLRIRRSLARFIVAI